MSLNVEEVEERANEYYVGTGANLLLLIWRAPPSMDGVTAVQRGFERLRDGGIGDIGFVTLVALDAAGGNPPTDVRNALTTVVRENDAEIKASILVFEGTGFRSAIVRSIVTAIQLAGKTSFPTSVVSSVNEGVVWLEKKMNGSMPCTGEELRAAIGTLR